MKAFPNSFLICGFSALADVSFNLLTRGRAITIIDTSRFQLGAPADLDPEERAEEEPLLAALEADARAYVESRPWAPPIAELLLAYGVGGILGPYLVRFEAPLPDGDLERVGGRRRPAVHELRD